MTSLEELKKFTFWKKCLNGKEGGIAEINS